MLLNSKSSVFEAHPLQKHVSTHRSRNVKYKNIVINFNQKNTGKIHKVFHSMLKYFSNSKKVGIQLKPLVYTVQFLLPAVQAEFTFTSKSEGATTVQLLYMRHL
jgi:hypothetical protein